MAPKLVQQPFLHLPSHSSRRAHSSLLGVRSRSRIGITATESPTPSTARSRAHGPCTQSGAPWAASRGGHGTRSKHGKDTKCPCRTIASGSLTSHCSHGRLVAGLKTKACVSRHPMRLCIRALVELAACVPPSVPRQVAAPRQDAQHAACLDLPSAGLLRWIVGASSQASVVLVSEKWAPCQLVCACLRVKVTFVARRTSCCLMCASSHFGSICLHGATGQSMPIDACTSWRVISACGGMDARSYWARRAPSNA